MLWAVSSSDGVYFQLPLSLRLRATSYVEFWLLLTWVKFTGSYLTWADKLLILLMLPFSFDFVYYGYFQTVDCVMEAYIAVISSNLYLTKFAIVAWAKIVSHKYVSNLIPGSLPIYSSLAADLKRWSSSKILWTNFHKRFQKYDLSYTLVPSNFQCQRVIKSLKPIRKVKYNCRHSGESSLYSGSYMCRIAAFYWILTNAAWYYNWRCKLPVPYIPRISHIRVHKLYYENCALFSSTKTQIYDKEKCDQVKVVLLYKSAIYPNTFLFDPIDPKMGHIQVV